MSCECWSSRTTNGSQKLVEPAVSFRLWWKDNPERKRTYVSRCYGSKGASNER